MLLPGLMLVTMAVASPAVAKAFRTVPGDEKNVVQFVSNATLERIVGRTHAVTGSVDVDPANLLALSNGLFEVDLRSLDTGIAMRNQDMRTNYLETDEHPIATFKLRRVISADQDRLQPRQTVNLVLEGEFTVRGVPKVYEIPVTITYTPAGDSPEASQRLYSGQGDLLSVTAEWRLKLSDHGIVRPAFLFMRLAEEQQVSVAFALTDILPPAKP